MTDRAAGAGRMLAAAVTVALGLALVGAAATAGSEGAARAAPLVASAEVAARFAAASEQMSRGEAAAAAAAFTAIAAAVPDDRLAPDALFAAARLFEEELADPARARDLYREVIARYPDARTAVAAGRRAAALDAALGPGDRDADTAARFGTILQRFPERPESESIALAEALVAESPDWAGLPGAVLWLGELHRREGRLDEATRWYEHAVAAWPASEVAADARLGLAQIATARGKFGEAETLSRALLADAGDAIGVLAAEESLEEVARARRRARADTAAMVALTVALLLFLASLVQATGGGRALWQALWPPPEVLFMLPVIVFFYAIAGDVAGAVARIGGGGLLITWLSGAALAASRRQRRARHRLRTLVHAVLIAVAVPALAYDSVYRENLLDQVIDTIRFGPDE